MDATNGVLSGGKADSMTRAWDGGCGSWGGVGGSWGGVGGVGGELGGVGESWGSWGGSGKLENTDTIHVGGLRVVGVGVVGH